MKEYTMYLTQEELDVLFHTLGELHYDISGKTYDTLYGVLKDWDSIMVGNFFDSCISEINSEPRISLP